MSDQHEQLIRVVVAKGLLELDEPVTLASGDRSRYFVDGKRALAAGDDLRLACEALVELTRREGIDFDAVGGMTLGADQFAHGIAMLTGCEWFVVRKAAKGRGTNRRIEGSVLTPTTRVLLVDDVVTRGGSIQEAYKVIVDETGRARGRRGHARRSGNGCGAEVLRVARHPLPAPADPRRAGHPLDRRGNA